MKHSFSVSMMLTMGLCGAFHGQAHAKPVQSRGHFALTIDGEPAMLKDFDGGNSKGEVVTFGLVLSPGVVDWLVDSLSGELTSSDIDMVELDDDGEVLSELHIQQAVITEVTIPKLDGGSKEATFTVSGQRVDGHLARVASNIEDSTIQGSSIAFIETAADDEIDALVIKRTTTESGARLLYEAYTIKAPRDVATGQASGRRQHEPIRITREWEATSPQIFTLAVDKPESRSENIRKVKVELYVEQIAFRMAVE